MSTVVVEPEVEGEPSESEAPSSRGRAGLGRAALVMGLVGLVFAAVILAVANGDDRSTPDPVEYVVGPDVGAEIASGEADDLLPEIIRLTPGQDLVLRNNDWRPHSIGDLCRRARSDGAADVRLRGALRHRNLPSVGWPRDDPGRVDRRLRSRLSLSAILDLDDEPVARRRSTAATADRHCHRRCVPCGDPHRLGLGLTRRRPRPARRRHLPPGTSSSKARHPTRSRSASTSRCRSPTIRSASSARMGPGWTRGRPGCRAATSS